jgi:hypothetical protein
MNYTVYLQEQKEKDYLIVGIWNLDNSVNLYYFHTLVKLLKMLIINGEILTLQFLIIINCVKFIIHFTVLPILH